ncbi:MAG TPA: hypothetical protein VF444_22520 [Pseudonocardiaceae bacterium]
MTRPRQGTITTFQARVGLVRHLTGAAEQTSIDLVRRLTAEVLSAVSTDITNHRWPADATPADVAEWLAEAASEIQG